MKRHIHHPVLIWKKSLVFLLLLVVAGLPGVVCGQEPPRRAPLVVVSDDNYPPYLFRDASGKVRGILTDQWALWEQKTGVKVDLKAMDWSEAQRLMREGRADVIDTIFFTEERAKVYDFTSPYANIEVPVYAHKTLGGISDIPSLKGFTIGVKAGDAVIDYLTRRGIDSLKEYPSYEAIILAAKSQEIKVFSVDQPAAVYYLYKHGIADEFRQSFVLYTGQFHRAVHKNRSDLLRLVQDGFHKISRREYRAIDQKWMGSPFLLKVIIRQWGAWILGGLAVILALAMGNVLLGRRVRAKTSELRTALEGLRQSLAARQKSEEALRESHALLLLFMRHSPICAFIKEVTATESRTLMASDNYQQMIGIPGSEMVGKTMEELFPPEFAAKISADDRAVVTKGEVLQLDEEMNGRYYVTVKFPIAQKGKTLLAGYTIDITERKRIEQALDTAMERYNLLAKQNRIVTWSLDVHGLYTSLGAETIDTTERRPDNLVNKTYFYELHPEEGREEFKAKVLGYVKRGESFRNLVHPVMTESGGITWFSSSGIPMRDDRGNILGAWGTSTDITDLKRAEEEKVVLQKQLTDAQKLESIGRLAGGVAHDFNNMLQAILGFTEIALREVSPGQSLHNNLVEIKKAVQRSTNLTNQLQTFACTQTVAPKALNINEVVEGISGMLCRLIGKDIHLEWKPGRDIGTVMMGSGQIDQIVANLCVNARDAIGKSGHIAIATANVEITPAKASQISGVTPGAYVLLSIRDDGSGMSPDVRDRVFEPFFTTKPFGKGIGLGLATVYGIVKQNGGNIRVDSAPGKGTVFQIYLPRCAGEQAASEPLAYAGVEAPAAHATILLVDDDETILRTTRLILENLGYQVLATASPKAALQLFEEHINQVDLLIVDVIMPDMNGPEMVRQMLKRHPKLKHLFMSGYTANLLAEQGVGENSINFIQKPFSLKTLAQKVQEILAKK